jgi:hypothetical protein
MLRRPVRALRPEVGFGAPRGHFTLVQYMKVCQTIRPPLPGARRSKAAARGDRRWRASPPTKRRAIALLPAVGSGSTLNPAVPRSRAASWSREPGAGTKEQIGPNRPRRRHTASCTARGQLGGLEGASHALFAADPDAFRRRGASWPAVVSARGAARDRRLRGLCVARIRGLVAPQERARGRERALRDQGVGT